MEPKIERDSYGIPLDKPWRDVRFKDEDVEFNLMDWQANLQTELGTERLKIRRLEIERKWFIEWHRLWYMKGSVKRWMLLTLHRMKTPESLKIALEVSND